MAATLLDRNVDLVGDTDNAADVLQPAHAARHPGRELAEVGMNRCRRQSGRISITKREFQLCDPSTGITANRQEWASRQAAWRADVRRHHE